MPTILAQWLPVIFMVLAIWVGLIYNNRRLDDFKDLLKAEIGRAENNMLRAIAELRTEPKTDLARLEGRVANLERPTLTRP